MWTDPCRTSETDRLETVWVLSAIAVVVTWVLFLGGCSTSSSAAAAEPEYLQDDAALLEELAALRAERRPDAEPSPNDAGDDEPDVRVISIIYDHYASHSAYAVDRAIQHERRSLDRDIHRLRRDVRRYSSGGRLAPHRRDCQP